MALLPGSRSRQSDAECPPTLDLAQTQSRLSVSLAAKASHPMRVSMSSCLQLTASHPRIAAASSQSTMASRRIYTGLI